MFSFIRLINQHSESLFFEVSVKNQMDDNKQKK